MKCIILKNNLIEGLGLVERSVGHAGNLPILKNIHLSARDGNLFLVSTNLEIAIEHTLSGKILEDGECTIPFSLFSNIIKNIPSERITIQSTDNYQIIITTDNYEATIQGQDAKDFPIIPKIQNKENAITMPSGVLKNALEAVIVASQYSEIRPEISGVYVHYDGECLVLVATDSFRLAEKKIISKEVSFVGSLTSFIVPLKTIEEILRIISQKEEDITLLLDAGQIALHGINTHLISRLVDGRFPEYQAIIPKETKGSITVNRGELASAIKLTSTLSGKANDIALKIGEHGNHLEVYSRDAALGENHYHLPIKQKGDVVPLMFNWRYVFDGLKIYGGEDVVLSMTASDRPVSITCASDPSLLYVVMPLRL